MAAILQLQMNTNLFLRDPQETELGRKIISSSISMIDEMGFEAFTFKKLATEISSTEASIYRYFENKHRLLVYLIAWYWMWLEYKIDYGTHNIPSAEKRLEIALRLVSEEKLRDPQFPDIDEAALYQIVINESDKTYLTKHVDDDNKEGLFRGYKSLCKKIADIIKEINPDFKYSHALISTMLQASQQQIYYAQHLPSLTEVTSDNGTIHEDVFDFLKTITEKSIS
jgi:AcrR family transcriptional regulator